MLIGEMCLITHEYGICNTYRPLCAGGVPDAPETTLEGSVLMWTPPEANGSPIDRYEILARYGIGQ